MQSDEFKGLDDAYEKVRAFHAAFSLPVASYPDRLSASRVAARVNWMREELSELLSADDLLEQVDAVSDLMYLALGCLVEMGVQPGIPFTAVHRTNHEKRWPDGTIRLNAEGKLLKPPGWIGPQRALSLYLAELQTQRIARADDEKR
jgi:predicted HAD superfamily Cof-like phosphohydrolase